MAGHTAGPTRFQLIRPHQGSIREMTRQPFSLAIQDPPGRRPVALREQHLCVIPYDEPIGALCLGPVDLPNQERGLRGQVAE